MLPRRCRSLGITLLCAGCLVLLALVLPTGCWWFLLSLSLMGGGLFLMRRG